MNVVMTSSGRFVEVQGTAEGLPFTRTELDELLSLGEHGIAQILDAQAEVLATLRPPAPGRRGDGLRAGHRQPGQGGRDHRDPRCAPVELRPRPAGVAEVEETGETLEDNARLKARALAAATGCPAMADDTGLEVDGLGGAPRRVLGPLRRRGGHLRRQRGQAAPASSRVPPAGTGAARFRTVALAAWPDGRGGGSPRAWSRAPSPGRGAGVGGFGYDPVFVPDEGDGRTFAELAEESPDGQAPAVPPGPGLRRPRRQAAGLTSAPRSARRPPATVTSLSGPPAMTPRRRRRPRGA